MSLFHTELPPDSSMKWETKTTKDCAKCRSQIEAKTRQKCWEDLFEEYDDVWSITGSSLEILKKKWRIKK